MNLALDAMGGDNAPREIVLGAVAAAPMIRGTISLVGDPTAIAEFLPKPVPPQINIVPASQVITMEDKPLDAIRKKKDSSLAVCIQHVTAGIADAAISAGNTGAATAASLLAFRPIPGVHRPAVVAQFPRKNGHFILLDAGASPDIDPEMLLEFARLGRVFSEVMLDVPNPSVHLLNIGEEEGKGNAFAKQAFKLLEKYDWFRGNVEGKDMFRDPHVDVVVCDAFIGNIVLKTSEGVAEFIMSEIRSQIPKGTFARLPYLPLRSLLAPLRKKTDYAEYGGMPLLGLNGLTFICHGRSNAKAIKNALLQAQHAVEADLLGKTKSALVE